MVIELYVCSECEKTVEKKDLAYIIYEGEVAFRGADMRYICKKCKGK